MLYHRRYPIEFNHCDPAGIVFYPRYFEMTNHVCENFFREVADWPFAAMIAAGSGVPTVRIETDFSAPSRLGDVLDVSLEILRLGESSITFEIIGRGAGQLRLRVRLTLVHVAGTGGAIAAKPWPEPVRARLTSFKEAA
ncbi:acyl-CoA thioesterase [bacterium]|nr:acyl-CoA thioesterase [bacterium]